MMKSKGGTTKLPGRMWLKNRVIGEWKNEEKNLVYPTASVGVFFR